MKIHSLPFAVARSSITATAWLEGPAQAPEKPLPAQLPHWDPAVEFVVHNELTLDPMLLAKETGLGLGSRLRVSSGWYCEATRTRTSFDPHDVVLSGNDHVTLMPSFSLRGSRLARSVVLENRVVLVAAAPASGPTAARFPGSVLWAFSQELVLEGQHSRFPMEWADFASSIYGDHAAWALDWDPQDLDCSTLGGVTLLLNQAHPVTSPLFREEPPSAAAKLLWGTLDFDVARQLIEGALTNDDFVANPEFYGDGTLGATIRRLINVHFPHHNITTLRALVVRSRTQFEALLQTSMRIYGRK